MRRPVRLSKPQLLPALRSRTVRQRKCSCAGCLLSFRVHVFSEAQSGPVWTSIRPFRGAFGKISAKALQKIGGAHGVLYRHFQHEFVVKPCHGTAVDAFLEEGGIARTRTIDPLRNFAGRCILRGHASPARHGLRRSTLEAVVQTPSGCASDLCRGRLRSASPACRPHLDGQGGTRSRPDPSNLQSLCHAHHNRLTRAYDAGSIRGACDVDGNPLDPSHPWAMSTNAEAIKAANTRTKASPMLAARLKQQAVRGPRRGTLFLSDHQMNLDQPFLYWPAVVYDVCNGAKKQSQLRHISGRPFNSRCFTLTQMWYRSSALRCTR